MEKQLTKREKMFCCLYASMGNVREAAVKAGYKTEPEQSGQLLLQKGCVQKEIDAYRKQHKEEQRQLVLKGYERLAFGSIADAVRLLYAQDLSDLPLEELDLFCISEIKKKDGLVELKFFNRLAAMEKLLEALFKEEDGQADKTIPFYQALQQGVQALNQNTEGV